MGDDSSHILLVVVAVPQANRRGHSNAAPISNFHAGLGPWRRLPRLRAATHCHNRAKDRNEPKRGDKIARPEMGVNVMEIAGFCAERSRTSESPRKDDFS